MGEGDSGDDPRVRILDAATRLFAAHGFHGVSTRTIGRAAGLNIATINYHVGTKRDLYNAVVQRLYEQERMLLAGYLEQVDPAVFGDPQAFLGLVDRAIEAMLALIVAQPERPRLYMHRWLEPRDELTPIEAELSLEQHRMMREMLERGREGGAVRADLDIGMFLRSLSWMLYGFCATGPIDWNRWFGDPTAADSQRELRAYMSDYARRMLAPD